MGFELHKASGSGQRLPAAPMRVSPTGPVTLSASPNTVDIRHGKVAAWVKKYIL